MTDERVGHIEKEVEILVTVHGRSEMETLERAREDLGAEVVEEILKEALKWVRGGDAVCALCGFNISAKGRETKWPRGRQWMMSSEIHDGIWACGLCKDTIFEIVRDI